MLGPASSLSATGFRLHNASRQTDTDPSASSSSQTLPASSWQPAPSTSAVSGRQRWGGDEGPKGGSRLGAAAQQAYEAKPVRSAMLQPITPTKPATTSRAPTPSWTKADFVPFSPSRTMSSTDSSPVKPFPSPGPTQRRTKEEIERKKEEAMQRKRRSALSGRRSASSSPRSRSPSSASRSPSRAPASRVTARARVASRRRIPTLARLRPKSRRSGRRTSGARTNSGPSSSRSRRAITSSSPVPLVLANRFCSRR
ncbi:hypothetical protein AAT19DRAFT_13179 [Rhodotorula toruloides]|uniref:Uncharacterized protein n=1 Tax=Rhodotorula toruloides TaxID=5286 RepID=A0A2T0ADT2_RHOTO|nr:hypothetical protein AAT19DRAFT_13179 [Rhodotorula toruloides]